LTRRARERQTCRDCARAIIGRRARGAGTPDILGDPPAISYKHVASPRRDRASNDCDRGRIRPHARNPSTNRARTRS